MTLTFPEVEGLTKLTGPSVHRGLIGSKFALPEGFDTNKHASKWAEDGHGVEEAQQDIVLPSVGAKAQGWTVWKDSKGKIFLRVVGKVKYVLMFRPKALQQALNNIYAAESRDLANAELEGRTNRANEGNDPGVLSAEDLNIIRRAEGENPELLPRVPAGKNPSNATTTQLQ